MFIAELDDKVSGYVMIIVPIIERKVNVPWKNALKSNFLTKANAFLAVKKTFLRGNSSSSTFCIFSSFYVFSAGGAAASVSVINIRYIIFQISITFITSLANFKFNKHIPMPISEQNIYHHLPLMFLPNLL